MYQLFVVKYFFVLYTIIFALYSLVPSLPDLTRVENIGETEDEASVNLQLQSTELVQSHTTIHFCIHLSRKS